MANVSHPKPNDCSWEAGRGGPSPCGGGPGGPPPPPERGPRSTAPAAGGSEGAPGPANPYVSDHTPLILLPPPLQDFDDLCGIPLSEIGGPLLVLTRGAIFGHCRGFDSEAEGLINVRTTAFFCDKNLIEPHHTSSSSSSSSHPRDGPGPGAGGRYRGRSPATWTMSGRAGWGGRRRSSSSDSTASGGRGPGRRARGGNGRRAMADGEFLCHDGRKPCSR